MWIDVKPEMDCAKLGLAIISSHIMWIKMYHVLNTPLQPQYLLF